jgi:hypothetical protein
MCLDLNQLPTNHWELQLQHSLTEVPWDRLAYRTQIYCWRTISRRIRICCCTVCRCINPLCKKYNSWTAAFISWLFISSLTSYRLADLSTTKAETLVFRLRAVQKNLPWWRRGIRKKTEAPPLFWSTQQLRIFKNSYLWLMGPKKTKDGKTTDIALATVDCALENLTVWQIPMFGRNWGYLELETLEKQVLVISKEYYDSNKLFFYNCFAHNLLIFFILNIWLNIGFSKHWEFLS